MNGKRLWLAAVVASGLTYTASWCPVQADPLLEQTSKSIVAGAGAGAESDGSAALKALIDRVKVMRDYWYESKLTTINSKGKTIVEAGKFYFKAPQMVRFEATAAGQKTGSIVVKQPNGKIRAKAAGIFGGLTLSLSPHSKLLRTSNGYNIIESDLSTLLETLRQEVGTQLKCLSSSGPCSYPGLAKVYVLEFVGNGDAVSQRIALDTERKLPVAWTIFNGGKLFSVVQVGKLAVNADIDDALFVLGGPAKDEKAIGIAAIPYEDILQAKIDALGKDVVIDCSLCQAARNALAEVQREGKALSETSLTQPNASRPGGFVWSDDGRQALLSRTTKIESLANTVRNLTRGVSGFESSHQSECAGLTAQWNEDFQAIDESIENLYLALDNDTPDPKFLSGEAKNVADQAAYVESLLIKVEEQLQPMKGCFR